MQLKFTKTVHLRITRKVKPLKFTYQLNNDVISDVNEYKYLGVIIFPDLRWSQHIQNICSSASRKLGLLRRKLRSAAPSVKLQAYNSLVRPKLEYAGIVWEPNTKKNASQLEMVQRRAIRLINGKYNRLDSPSSLMIANNISSLQHRRKIARLKFLSLLYHNRLRIESSLYLSPSSSRETRHHHQYSLEPIFARTNIFKYSFFPRTITDWNALPRDIFFAPDFNGAFESHTF
uniref:Putative reverse transcriptase rna-dependent dna polymerase n=1 Tax=Ixodes ricinus TaxID=34613 RepID=A0A6B0V3F4_IXORI